MPDLTKTDVDPTQLMREAVREGNHYMWDRVEIWREAQDAWRAKGYVSDPTAVQVKLNRILEAVSSSIPRHASALWPQEPYLPIRSRRAEYDLEARYKTRVLSGAIDDANFFDENTRVLRPCQLYGNAGLFVDWDVWIENVEDRRLKVDELTGQVVDIGTESFSIQKDGLRLRATMPWNIGWPRAGNTPLEKAWMWVKTVIPIEEVFRLLEVGKWKLPEVDGKTISLEDFKDGLKAGPEPEVDSNFFNNMWQGDLGGFAKHTREDIVVMHRLFSAGRWLTTLNYRYTMEDTENQHKNMDRRIKPLAWMTIDPFPGENSFYGIGDWEKIRDLATLDDDLLSIQVDNLLQENMRWFLYDPKHIDEEDLVVRHGGTIAIKGGEQLDNFDRALRVMEPPSQDHGTMEFHGVLGEAIDRRSGQTDVLRGVAPSPKQTLGGTKALMEASATRLGFQTRYIENTYMYDLAKLISKYTAANMTLIQMVDAGGITFEQAREIMTPDPDSIPGGAWWEFEGAERVARRQQKNEALTAFWDTVAKHPLIDQGPGAAIVIKKMAERTEVFDDAEMEQLTQQAPSVEPVMPTGGELQSADAIVPENQLSTPAQNAEAPREAVAA